jgi:hypothetical protein
LFLVYLFHFSFLLIQPSFVSLFFKISKTILKSG